MKDISELSDEDLEKRSQELSTTAAAIREERKLLSEEMDRRANSRELEALAAKLGPAKLAELAKLAQSVAPTTVTASPEPKQLGP